MGDLAAILGCIWLNVGRLVWWSCTEGLPERRAGRVGAFTTAGAMATALTLSIEWFL